MRARMADVQGTEEPGDPFHFFIPSDGPITMVELPEHTRQFEFVVRADLDLSPAQERKFKRGNKNLRVYHGIAETERFELLDTYTANVFLRHRDTCSILYPNGNVRHFSRSFGIISEHTVTPIESIEFRLAASRRFLAENRDPGKQAHHLRGLISLIKLQEDPELAYRIIDFFAELNDLRKHLAVRIHDTTEYIALRHNIPHTRTAVRVRQKERRAPSRHIIREVTQRAGS